MPVLKGQVKRSPNRASRKPFFKVLLPACAIAYSHPNLKRRIQFLVIGLAIALFLGRSTAADSTFTVDVWNGADRLPENTVIALTQTRDGYLWVGTENGLARFDGNSFTPFNVNNLPGLPNNVINFLFEDRQTNFWVGTGDKHLCLIQHGALKSVFNVSAARGKITAAYEAPDHALLFATDLNDALAWVDGDLIPNPELPENARGFLRRLAGHVESPASDGRSGQLLPQPWTNATASAICQDDAGNLIVGTKGQGVFWFEPDGQARQISTAAGLSSSYVLSVCFDSEKNLWVGTDGGGLDRVRKRLVAAPAGLSGGVALSVAEDAQGGLWTAFNLGGVTRWQTNAAWHFDIEPGNSARSVLVDQRQNVWVGTFDSGLFRLENDHFEFVTNAPTGPQISALFSTREGSLLVGSDAGLAVFDGREWASVPGLPRSSVCALAQDTNRTIWIGTETEGLFQWRDYQVTPVNSPLKDISALLVSTNGGLGWAVRAMVSLGAAPPATGNSFPAPATGSPTTTSVRWWRTTSATYRSDLYEGLVRVEQRSFSNVISGAARTLVCRTFSTRECSAGAQPAAIRARDGRLWFPTIEGVVSVDPSDLRPNTNPPPVIMESVRVDGVELKTNFLGSSWTGTVRLTPANRELDFRFASLSFSAPKGAQFGARFHYRLQEASAPGDAKNWTEISTERVAHFQKLAPGSYTFTVQACNEDGIWNESGVQVSVVVEPPFWRRPGFIVASVLILLGVVAGTIYLIATARLRRELRLAQQKEMVEHERARIARDLHDQLGANLTQITLLGEMAESDKDLPAEVEEHAQQICSTARETTRSLDEIVWAVNPSNDTLEGLVNYACKYAQDYFAMANVSYRSELPAGLPPIPILPEVRHNVFLAFKEAVNNVVKHAQAREAHVKLLLDAQQFTLMITDNGRGVGDLSGKKLRNGLKNMRRRLSDVHGQFDIAPGPQGGTVVKLTVPINGHTPKAD